MVKNEKGGCNGKKVAHKHAVKSTKSGLRISQNKSEIYGVVKRLNGNTFDVMCIDDKERRCFIRGKFKGRGKRDNIIEVDKWVLVGIREFQQAPNENAIKSNSKGKKEMEMCDLLEVYSSGEKDTLKRTHGIFMKESELSRASTTVVAMEDVCDFVDNDTLRYQKIVSSKSSSSIETIKMRGKNKLAPANNVVNPQAMYGDINDIDSDSDIDEEESEDQEEEESEDQEEEESEDQKEESEDQEEEESEDQESEGEEKHYADNSNNSNKNKMCSKVEINVDDI
jgi:translation initiation factor IF-1